MKLEQELHGARRVRIGADVAGAGYPVVIDLLRGTLVAWSG